MLEAAQRCAETLEDGEAGQAEEHPLPSAPLVSTAGLLLPSNAPSTLAARGQKWLEKRSEHIASTRKQLDEARRDMESKDLVFSPKINPAVSFFFTHWPWVQDRCLGTKSRTQLNAAFTLLLLHPPFLVFHYPLHPLFLAPHLPHPSTNCLSI
jgi:hypothetical protein